MLLHFQSIRRARVRVETFMYKTVFMEYIEVLNMHLVHQHNVVAVMESAVSWKAQT